LQFHGAVAEIVMKAKWAAADIPNLGGRTALVTGSSSGVGYEIALQLARRGAHVILAARNQGRTEQAAHRIKTDVPGASVAAQLLDLADLASVRRCAEEFFGRHDCLDILVNNAGIAGGPRRGTADGLEAHFQINYLGHFALTGLLQPALRSRAGSRVVTVSSDIASRGRINFDDLPAERRYGWITAYAQSKLAALLFAFELDRRSQHAGMTSLAAHPGAVNSNLLTDKEQDWGRQRRGMENVIRAIQVVLGRSAAAGALPILYQAAEPLATRGEYIGPSGKDGYPVVSKIPAAALDQGVAKRLWEVSERLTGVHYGTLAGVSMPGDSPRIRGAG
jgi:NAD(P)-dependent dehydrogenase (short-subunit alcohol dehydrogenase family)